MQKKQNNITRVEIREEVQNVGTIRHLNHVIPLCHGDYIMVLSADDVLYSEQVLSKHVESFRTSAPDCSIQMTQIAMCNETLSKLWYFYVRPMLQNAVEATCEDSTALLHIVLQYGNLLPAVGLCYRKDFFERFGPFDEDYTYMQSYSMYSRLAKEKWTINYGNFVAVKHRYGGLHWDGQNASDQALALSWLDFKKMDQDILEENLSELPEDKRERAIQRAKWQLRCADTRLMELDKTLNGKLIFAFQHPCLALQRLLYKLHPWAEKWHLTVLKLWLVFLFFAPVVQPMFQTLLGTSADGLSWAPYIPAAVFAVIWGASVLIRLFWWLLDRINRLPVFDD